MPRRRFEDISAHELDSFDVFVADVMADARQDERQRPERNPTLDFVLFWNSLDPFIERHNLIEQARSLAQQ